MKERGFVCLLCRQKSVLRPPLRTPQRWITYPAQHEREPDVSPSLDATNNHNPRARSYDNPPPADIQIRNGSILVRRMYPTEQSFRYSKRQTSPSWHTFDRDGRNILPIDLVTYVLFGESDASLYGKKNRAKVQQKSGSNPQIAILRKIEELASTFIMDDDARLSKYGFNITAKHMEKFRTTIEKTHSLHVLQRIISTFSSTKEGCQWLSRNGDAICTSIRLCRKQQGVDTRAKASCSMVLRMLNNLHRSMESKGVAFGSTLCNRAMYYAAKAGSLPAVKMYLELCQKNSYEYDFYGYQVSSELLISFAEFESLSDPKSPRTKARRTGFLTLLTGWEEGAPRDGETQKFSIRSIIKNNQTTHTYPFYRHYLFTIGQLGLTDTILAEWNTPSLDPRLSDVYKISRAHLFALAFSLAGDSRHVEQVLSSIANIPTASPEERSSHKAFAWASALRGMIYYHYKANNLHATSDVWQRVITELLHIPRDPEGALAVLNRYILNEYQRGVQKRRVVIEKLEDGTEALMVWPLKEGGPLFAKALSRRSTAISEVGEEEHDTGDDNVYKIR